MRKSNEVDQSAIDISVSNGTLAASGVSLFPTPPEESKNGIPSGSDLSILTKQEQPTTLSKIDLDTVKLEQSALLNNNISMEQNLANCWTVLKEVFVLHLLMKMCNCVCLKGAQTKSDKS